MGQAVQTGLGWLLIALCLPAFAFAGWYAWSAAFAPGEQLDGYRSAFMRVALESGTVEAVRRQGELESRAGRYRFDQGFRAVIFACGAGLLIGTGRGLLRPKTVPPAAAAGGELSVPGTSLSDVGETESRPP